MKKQYTEKSCLNCGKLHSRRGVTCSNNCAAILRNKKRKNIELTCELCGNKFHNKVGRGKYCNKKHYKNCEVCSKKFIISKGKENKLNPTCGASCGATYSHRSSNNKEIRKQNSLKKWKVEHPFQAEEVKEKIEKSIQGTAGRFGTEASKKAIQKIYGVENVSSLEEIKQKKAKTFKENYIDKGIFIFRGPVSKTNIRWREKLEKETATKWEHEKYFSGVGAIDLYSEINGIPIAIEINPTATHNSYYNIIACSIKNCIKPCAEHALSPNYHYNKTKLLKDLYDISLISVFDWMSEEKIVSLVKSKTGLNTKKFDAEETEIVFLTPVEAHRLLKEFHCFEEVKNLDYCLGLTVDGQIIGVQSYSNLNNNIFEMRNLAFRDDFSIIGGAEKLTNFFVKNFTPFQIVHFQELSSLDFSIQIESFEKFDSLILSPRKCLSKGRKMVLDSTVSHSFVEEEFLRDNWLPVWDCGVKENIWTL